MPNNDFHDDYEPNAIERDRMERREQTKRKGRITSILVIVIAAVVIIGIIIAVVALVGKNKKPGLGLSIALGERGPAIDAALRLQRQYRDQIVKGLEWIKKNGAAQLNTIFLRFFRWRFLQQRQCPALHRFGSDVLRL